MSRSVESWVATHDDQAIPMRVKARIWLRCGGKCALTGRKLRSGEADFDHIVPLSMGGAHAEANLQLVCRVAHREKTAAEAGPRAKADRIFAKHNGLWPESKAKIQSRGFAETRAKPRERSA
jgi:5-methylcytosine-specific restriction protein A